MKIFSLLIVNVNNYDNDSTSNTDNSLHVSYNLPNSEKFGSSNVNTHDNIINKNDDKNENNVILTDDIMFKHLNGYG